MPEVWLITEHTVHSVRQLYWSEAQGISQGQQLCGNLGGFVFSFHFLFPIPPQLFPNNCTACLTASHVPLPPGEGSQNSRAVIGFAPVTHMRVRGWHWLGVLFLTC